jgi:hypothetical protein
MKNVYFLFNPFLQIGTRKPKTIFKHIVVIIVYVIIIGLFIIGKPQHVKFLFAKTTENLPFAIHNLHVNF